MSSWTDMDVLQSPLSNPLSTQLLSHAFHVLHHKKKETAGERRQGRGEKKQKVDESDAKTQHY